MMWAAEWLLGVMDYRLAHRRLAAGHEDLRRGSMGVENITTRRRSCCIFLMGHSAGAVHVASYVSHPEFYKVKGGGLAGAIMLSGIYDLTARPASIRIGYFGADPARYAERSSLQGLLTTNTPLMIGAAELDPPNFVHHCTSPDAACNRSSGCSPPVYSPAQPHVGGYSINTTIA